MTNTPTRTSTVTLTPTRTPTPTATPIGDGQMLVGEQTLGDMLDYTPAGLAEAFPYTASGSGTTTTLHVYLEPTARPAGCWSACTRTAAAVRARC